MTVEAGRDQARDPGTPAPSAGSNGLWLTVVVLIALVVAGVTLLWPSGGRTLPSGTATYRQPPSGLDPLLRSLIPAARNLMTRPGSTWTRTAAVRELVRASIRGQSCGTMSIAFWDLGRAVGLPLRLVNTSANGQNAYDTHAAVEVWLDSARRWVISDPTFNGYWTVGSQ